MLIGSGEDGGKGDTLKDRLAWLFLQAELKDVSQSGSTHTHSRGSSLLRSCLITA